LFIVVLLTFSAGARLAHADTSRGRSNKSRSDIAELFFFRREAGSAAGRGRLAGGHGQAGFDYGITGKSLRIFRNRVKPFDERVGQAHAHGCDQVRKVAFRPQGEILWVDDLRVEQASGMARQPMRLALNDPH
jgi:hypothetical protein